MAAWCRQAFLENVRGSPSEFERGLGGDRFNVGDASNAVGSEKSAKLGGGLCHGFLLLETFMA
jgi:hypothetical protein